MEPSICGPCVYGIKLPVFSMQPFGNGVKLLFVVWSILPVQDVEASVMVGAPTVLMVRSNLLKVCTSVFRNGALCWWC